MGPYIILLVIFQICIWLVEVNIAPTIFALLAENLKNEQNHFILFFSDYQNVHISLTIGTMKKNAWHQKRQSHSSALKCPPIHLNHPVCSYIPI